MGERVGILLGVVDAVVDTDAAVRRSRQRQRTSQLTARLDVVGNPPQRRRVADSVVSDTVLRAHGNVARLFAQHSQDSNSLTNSVDQRRSQEFATRSFPPPFPPVPFFFPPLPPFPFPFPLSPFRSRPLKYSYGVWEAL